MKKAKQKVQHIMCRTPLCASKNK